MLNVEEIQRFITEDKTSTKKIKAKEGQRYYEAEHDILNYKLFYYNADGVLTEDKTRTNIKISHPFFTELVDQEVQYMLSNGEAFIKSKNLELQSLLNEYFDDDFKSELSEVLTGAISKGFEYMYAYKNTDDRLAFQCADSLGVIEVRAKDTDDGCSYIIYWYIDRIDKGKKAIKRIQVSDQENTWYYTQVDDGKIEEDESEKVNPRPHIIYTKEDGSKYWESLGFVPFFRLDNCKKQFSSLKPIKALIDDYDIMSCSLSNNLQDFDTPIHVVKGYSGDNLDELQQNLKTKKIIGVDDEGGIEVKTVDVPYAARQTKLDLDEKNIYRFGMGFNSAQSGDGNITNIVIKSRYALLDLKCNKLEIRLRQFLKNIVRAVINEINMIHDTDYQMKDVYFEFNREVMTNASDNATIEKTDAETQQLKINSLLNVASLLDNETTLEEICGILDIDYEKLKDRISKGDIEDADKILNQIVPEDGE